MKVLAIFGTRPEIIKLAPVISALKKAKVDTITCASGQHKEMLAPMLDLFELEPDITLSTMLPKQTLNLLSSKLLIEIDKVLEQQEPDWLIVQGDTTTALCAGLAAFHRKIKVAHVEAGLRTGDITSPFPEEANRKILSCFASLHFAPTDLAKQMLINEGVEKNVIYTTGNTVVDAIQMTVKLNKHKKNSKDLELALTEANGKPLVLVTCHRRENFGNVIEDICKMLLRLCKRYNNYQWIFPVHLNPNVREPVFRILSGIANLTLLPPVDYQTSLELISRSSLVVSDSGGIQEEAPTFGVPVVIMRNHTERQEGVKFGFASLAGQEPVEIEEEVINWLDSPEKRLQLKNRKNPYGDGRASIRIINTLLSLPIDEFKE